MDQFSVIVPGSLDLDEATLRIGAVDTSPLDNLKNSGNKFVVAEYFVDRDGKPLDDRQFDARTMCYALFVAPVTSTGRHKQVIPYHGDRITGRTGDIVGGGMLIMYDNTVGLEGMSFDFGQEPLAVRLRLAEMLVPVFRERWLEPSLHGYQNGVHPSAEAFYGDDTNVYWLRFRQVLEAMKQRHPDQVEQRISNYVQREEFRVRTLIQAHQQKPA